MGSFGRLSVFPRVRHPAATTAYLEGLGILSHRSENLDGELSFSCAPTIVVGFRPAAATLRCPMGLSLPSATTPASTTVCSDWTAITVAGGASFTEALGFRIVLGAVHALLELPSAEPTSDRAALAYAVGSEVDDATLHPPLDSDISISFVDSRPSSVEVCSAMLRVPSARESYERYRLRASGWQLVPVYGLNFLTTPLGDFFKLINGAGAEVVVCDRVDD